MKAITQTRAIGGSLTVTLPRKLVIAESLCEGELVEIEVAKVKQSFFGAAKGIGSFTVEDELVSHD